MSGAWFERKPKSDTLAGNALADQVNEEPLPTPTLSYRVGGSRICVLRVRVCRRPERRRYNRDRKG